MLFHVLTHTFPSLRDPSHLPFDLTDLLACGSLGCSMKRASSLGVLNEPDKPVGELKVRQHLSFLLFLSPFSFLLSFQLSLSLLSQDLHLVYIYLSVSQFLLLSLCFLAHLSSTLLCFSLTLLDSSGGVYYQHTHSSIITILTHIN